jgi:hypothetical protein
MPFFFFFLTHLVVSLTIDLGCLRFEYKMICFVSEARAKLNYFGTNIWI